MLSDSDVRNLSNQTIEMMTINHLGQQGLVRPQWQPRKAVCQGWARLTESKGAASLRLQQKLDAVCHYLPQTPELPVARHSSALGGQHTM